MLKNSIHNRNNCGNLWILLNVTGYSFLKQPSLCEAAVFMRRVLLQFILWTPPSGSDVVNIAAQVKYLHRLFQSKSNLTWQFNVSVTFSLHCWMRQQNFDNAWWLISMLRDKIILMLFLPCVTQHLKLSSSFIYRSADRYKVTVAHQIREYCMSSYWPLEGSNFLSSGDVIRVEFPHDVTCNTALPSACPQEYIVQSYHWVSLICLECPKSCWCFFFFFFFFFLNVLANAHGKTVAEEAWQNKQSAN